MELFAVFGNPIAHSKSPLLHNFVFHKLGVDAKYFRYHLEATNDFRDLFFALNLSGANITLPHKESLVSKCDEIRGIASKIGAINTIVREDERLVGYNTDAIGFYENIASFGVESALIFGAGGSARAIAMILQERGVKVSVINRSEGNLGFFYQNNFECFLSSQNEKFCGRKFDIVINATSSSISGDLPIDGEILRSIFGESKIAFDLMYGKKCAFLELAKTLGLNAVDGSKMLLYQAIYANELFLHNNFKKQIIAKYMNEIYPLI